MPSLSVCGIRRQLPGSRPLTHVTKDTGPTAPSTGAAVGFSTGTRGPDTVPEGEAAARAASAAAGFEACAETGAIAEPQGCEGATGSAAPTSTGFEAEPGSSSPAPPKGLEPEDGSAGPGSGNEAFKSTGTIAPFASRRATSGDTTAGVEEEVGQLGVAMGEGARGPEGGKVQLSWRQYRP